MYFPEAHILSKVNVKLLENVVLDAVPTNLSLIPETSMVLSVSMACSPVIITDDNIKEEVFFVHTQSKGLFI